MREDRRLNLFGHDPQKAPVSHGDTVPRVLAVLLESEPLLLDRFIDLINEKLRARSPESTPIPKPTARTEWEVGFRRSVPSLAEFENAPLRIVGLTLTLPDTPEGRNPGEDREPVTDIAVHFGDDLVLVEVKTPRATPGIRVTEQAQHLRAALERNGEKFPPGVVSPLEASWEEMADTLDDVYRLQGENELSVLGHYLRYLKSRYPLWHTAASFCGAGGPAAAQTRVQTFADDCALSLARKYGGDPTQTIRWGDASVIPLETFGFAREFHLSPEWDGSLFKGLKATLWLCNNKRQGLYFFNDESVRDDLSWTRGGKLDVAGESPEIEITPYVKFSHIMGRYVTDAYCAPEKIGTDRREVREKFFDPLVRKWKRNEWPDLRHFLTEDHPGLLKNPEGFKTDFEKFFEKSARQFTFVTFGFEIVMRFPIGRTEEINAGGSIEADSGEAAQWVANAVEALKAQISRPGT